MTTTRGPRVPGWVGDGLVAGAVGAVLGGIPSTLHAAFSEVGVLDATRAAGRIVARKTSRTPVVIVAAGLVHTVLSLGWGVALSAVLPRRRTVAWGAAGGMAIALLDLGVVGRRIGPVRDLRTGPQVADHVAYGAAVGAVLTMRRARDGGTGARPVRRRRRDPTS